MKVSRLTLMLMGSVLMNGTAQADNLFRLEKTLSVAQLPASAESVRYEFFATADGDVPVASQRGPLDEQLQPNGVLKASFSDIEALDQFEKVWLDVRVDGVLLGSRIPLAPVNTGVTFASGVDLDMSNGSIMGVADPGATDLDYATTVNYVNNAVLAGKDNLGNHTATTNIQLNGHYLSGDGDNEGVYVNSNGNVGVGTNTPQKRLSVKASGEAYVDVDRGNNQLGGISYREGGGATQWIVPFFRGWQNDNLIFRWDVAGTNKDVMFLEAETGNVGIGYDNSTNLTNKLQVNGDVQVTGAMKTALPTPGFDSGWLACNPTIEMTVAHALNVPVDNMVVDFIEKDGSNIRSPTGSANFWTKLTTSTIAVNCTFDQIRIRIWVYK